MPNRTIHIKIDENVLKPHRLIPKKLDTADFHACIDEDKIGGVLHRVLDKWHNPRYLAQVGYNSKIIKNRDYRERNYLYRIAMMHVIVDELATRFKNKNGRRPTYYEIENEVKKILSRKNWVRKHFNL